MYILGRDESNIFPTFLTCNIYKRENNWAMKHWCSFKKQQMKNGFTSTPRAPVNHFCTRWANLAWQLRNGAHFWDKSRAEREREPESLFRNTRIPKSSLATVTWLRLWAKESGTHPVERAGRVLCLLWTACEKWEQNQTEEEKALSSHRPESSRYCTSGPWQTCERKKDRTKERTKERKIE